jgi:hypothetical protein
LIRSACGAERDERVERALGGEFLRRERQLVGARHPHDREFGEVAAVALDAVLGSLEQLGREEAVETADDDAEGHALGVQLSGDLAHGASEAGENAIKTDATAECKRRVHAILS